MKKRKICVVTGTRAEYGLLYCLLRELRDSEEFELQVVATGMHLSPEYGLTYRIIEHDGFNINEKVEMLLSSDTGIGVAKSVGLGVIGLAEAFGRLRPDLLIVLGDRYEILAAVQTALFERIPVAHIAGGDVTEGAFDESIRHSITKMSHLHFVTNDIAAARVRQLGENPANIYNVGSPGIDIIHQISLLSKAELETELDFKFRNKNLLITFHPVTLGNQPSEQQFQNLLAALDELGNEFGLLFTKPNSDPESRKIIALLDEYTSQRSYAKAYTSLGQLRYLSAISAVDAVVGNSSSGLYEVPSFKKPTVNIGDRQKGRLQASSVINCQPQKEEILKAIRRALELNCENTVNPYGDGNSSVRIVKILKEIPDYEGLLQKHFFRMDCMS